jgi:hypothetical protein
MSATVSADIYRTYFAEYGMPPSMPAPVAVRGAGFHRRLDIPSIAVGARRFPVEVMVSGVAQ